MKPPTRKITLEIPEAAFQQLAQLAESTDQSVDSLAAQIVLRDLSALTDKVRNLDRLLARVTPSNLHSEIVTGERVGNEVW